MFYTFPKEAVCFPHPSMSEPDGLLAIGGDLSSERLQLAYAFGIFPWYSEGEPVLWYAPPERCVLFPNEVYISSSMKRLLRQAPFTVTVNHAFERVMMHCASTPRKEQTGTWITEDMKCAYYKLHLAGKAHSVEVWQDGQLVGGLYGVVHRSVFCGESMFSKLPNASKYALIWLCQSGRYRLIDCQLPNAHLLSLGARMLSRSAFMQHLRT